jgi:hypothetical protein
MPAGTRRAVAINYHFVRASSAGRFQLRAHERPARFAEQLAALADFYCNADPIGHQFWSHGWFSCVDDFHTQVPNWFYPIDMRIPPTTSLILWARDDVGALLDRSRVYITKGDCDMDRPTLNYFEAKGIEV